MQVIAPTVAPCSATVPDESIPNDAFHDARMKWVALALVIMVLAGFPVMTAIYVGSLYGTPSWSAASIPPPIAHKVK